jgi:hypothetical protein
LVYVKVLGIKIHIFYFLFSLDILLFRIYNIFMNNALTHTFKAGDLVRRNSMKPGVGNIKGIVETVKPNGTVIVRWGTGYRAHATTLQAKSLAPWDAEIAKELAYKLRAARTHCGVHGNSIHTMGGVDNYCWQCGGVAAEIIDGNEHRRRQQDGYTGRESVQ